MSIFSYLWFLCILVNLSLGTNLDKINDCSIEKQDSLRKLLRKDDFLIVSTLDGKITALDENNNGKIIWSYITHDEGLLSSTIGNFKFINNAISYQLVPSLDGTLYKVNEKLSILEPLSLNADKLLKNSYKFGGNLLISGGREHKTHAIDINSGDLIYSCGFDCLFSDTEKDNQSLNIMIIKQIRQKVRAIDPSNGAEQWRFSVGENTIYLLNDSDCGLFDDTTLTSVEDSIHIAVPEGEVRSYSNGGHEINWSFKFDSPIVGAWRYKDRQIKPLDIIQNEFPRIGFFNDHTLKKKPIIYIGSHNSQLYVQHFNFFTEKMKEISWKPSNHQYHLIPYLSSNENTSLPSQRKELQLTSDHDFGKFLLIQEKLYNKGQCKIHEKITKYNLSFDNLYNYSSAEGIEEIIITSVWHWWKEIFFITISIAIFINIAFAYIKGKFKNHPFWTFIFHYKKQNISIKSNIEINKECVSVQKSESANSNTTSESSLDSNASFISRYESDFESLSCLGRGGFGVVFEARNKIDDCNYAIKRITLPLRKEAREKVMREVKALAKLDHPNIVRYYNSWLETPPIDWEDKHNNTLNESYSICNFKSTNSSTKNIPVISKTSNISNFGDNLSDSYIVFEKSNSNKKATDKTAFVELTSLTHNENSKIDLRSSKGPKAYLYIQMQLCQKQTLKDWLKESNSRDSSIIHDIFIQIVNAVEYVHSMGLMHRDLKPSNIFFSMDNCVKIGDFGLVTASDEILLSNGFISKNEDNCYNVFHNNAENKNIEKSFTDNIGTKLYMSPEQINGSKYSNKVDIFALGVIFFELMSTFQTEMERIVVLSNIREQKFPNEFKSKNSQECSFVSQLLAADPNDRPSASDILNNPLYVEDTILIEKLTRKRTLSSSKS